MAHMILQGKVECSRIIGLPKKIECRILLCGIKQDIYIFNIDER